VIRHQAGEHSQAGQRIAEMRESEKLLVTPLAYIRGRSLQRIFFIVDEAQNLTPHEVKTIITRAGEGTKIVLTGDIRQIDQPYLDSLSNGLSYLINRMVGQAIYAHVTLEKGERSALADLASALL
jgi:PhoH-like ATPase